MRIGDHADKTRIVLDMSARAAYTATLQNGGKQLVIDLPQMGFSAKKNFTASEGSLVSGYRYEGGKLYLDILSPAQIKSQTIINPNGTPDFRLVIDIYVPGVHQ